MALLALALLTAPLAAAAQPPRQPAATEAMDVVLVNVEVWVNDDDGVPVRGLTAADFEVLDDGKPVPITHFAEMRAPLPATRLVAPEPPGAATGDARSEEAGYLILYFDALHLTTPSVSRVVRELEGFLASDQVVAGRVLLLRQAYDLYTEAGLGSSAEQVAAALKRLAGSAMQGETDAYRSLTRLQAAWEQARSVNIPRIGSASQDPCEAFVVRAKPEIASRVAELERRSGITLESLRATARLLGGLPGPKTLLFVSDALQTNPGTELVRFAQNVCPGRRELLELSLGSERVQLQERLDSFALEASRNRITVYPFQTAGLRGSISTGAEQGAMDVVGGRGLDTALLSAGRDGLLDLAHQTGGWAVTNRNQLTAELQRLADEMSSYYSLGYAPPHSGDGRNHTIEVRLAPGRARNLRLRHRLGYRDRGAEDPLQEGLDGAIAFGATRNPLGVRLGVGTLAKAGEGRYSVPLHVMVPSAGVAFLPQGSSEEATLRVVVNASNARSRDLLRFDQSFRPHRPPPQAELLDLRLTLQLPEGVHVIAVAVRDELTRESSVVATTIAIQDPAAAAAGTAGPKGSRPTS